MIEELPFKMIFILFVATIRAANKRSHGDAFSEAVTIDYNSKETPTNLRGKKICNNVDLNRAGGYKLDEMDSNSRKRKANNHDEKTQNIFKQQVLSNIPTVVQIYNFEESDEETKPINKKKSSDKKNQNTTLKQDISKINTFKSKNLSKIAENTKSQMSFNLDKEKTELELLIESVISKPVETSSTVISKKKEPEYSQTSNPVLSNKETTSTNKYNQFISLDDKLPVISTDDIKSVLEENSPDLIISLNGKQCFSGLNRDYVQENSLDMGVKSYSINEKLLNNGINSQTKIIIPNNDLKVCSDFNMHSNSLSGTQELNYLNFSERKNQSKNKQIVIKTKKSKKLLKQKNSKEGALSDLIDDSISYKTPEIPIFLKDYEDEIVDNYYLHNTRIENKEKSPNSIVFINKLQEKDSLPSQVFYSAEGLLEDKNLNPEENRNNEYFLVKAKNGNISIQSKVDEDLNQFKDNSLSINSSETENTCISKEADLGLPTKKQKCIAVLIPKHVKKNWKIERDITDCDENYHEIFKILYEKNDGGCIEVYSRPKNVYLINLYEDIEISEIVLEIESNYIIRFFHVISIFCNFQHTVKFLEYYNVDSRPEIKTEVDNFLKNFINDNILENDYWLEIKKINNEKGPDVFEKLEKNNINLLITPFNKFLENFCLKYEKLIGSFTDKVSILRLRKYIKFTYDDVAKVFAYEFKHFFKNEKYSVILNLFPEIEYLINYLKNSNLNFSSVKQVISVISFVLFKFLFLRKNMYYDLKCQFHLEKRDYLLSGMCSKFILNTRALLYFVYCKIMQKEKCVNMKKNILCHLFFNFLSVKSPGIFNKLEFDEHIFLENYEFGTILDNIFLFDISLNADGEKIKVLLISSLKRNFLDDFVNNTYKFLYKISINFSDYNLTLDFENIEIKNKLQGNYKKIKEDTYLKILQALNL